MRIEKLSLNKIKVTVNMEDLSLYDISYESLSPESPRLRSFILALMKRAEMELGFYAPAGNVLIEAIPQGDEFVFLITRIDTAKAQDTKKQELTREEKRERFKKNAFRAVEKTAEPKKTIKQYYRFENLACFADLLQVCMLPKTALLYKAGDCYYLSVPCSSPSAKRLNNLLPEFATPVDAQLIELYLKEHTKIVARGGEFDKILACFK